MARHKLQAATDERPFFLVYQDFIKSNVLETAEQKLLFIVLKSFANKNNTCFPSLQKLSNISKISKRKIQSTLKELESKGILKIEKRIRDDGGLTSNLYTLYDFKEIWSTNSCEEMAAIVDDFEERKMINILKAKGYKIEKGLASAPAKVTDTSTNNSLNSSNDYKEKDENCQENISYKLDVLKVLYEYDNMILDYPDLVQDIDVIINILYDTLNTDSDTIRIDRQNKQASIVKARLLKLSSSNIIYVINKYKEQTNRIKNPTSYILTLLFKAGEQMHLDVVNKVNYDMEHWNNT